MKKVSVLGSTGSVGKKTVDLLSKRKEEYQVEALSAHSNFALLAHQAKLLNAKYVAISDERLYKDLKESLLGTDVKIAIGATNIATIPVDLSVVAIVGIAGLGPVMEVIESGTKVICIGKQRKHCLRWKVITQKS